MSQMMQEPIEAYQTFSQNCFNCGKSTKNLLGYCKSKCKVEHIKKHRHNVHLNKELRFYINQLTDLFCLDHTPVVQLKTNWSQTYHGICHWHETPIRIEIGCKDGVSLKVLVHEFVHAMGYGHEWEINGWANFRSNCDMDNFSPLIVKDITGDKEVLL